jgi:hypothetical protein
MISRWPFGIYIEKVPMPSPRPAHRRHPRPFATLSNLAPTHPPPSPPGPPSALGRAGGVGGRQGSVSREPIHRLLPCFPPAPLAAVESKPREFSGARAQSLWI